MKTKGSKRKVCAQRKFAQGAFVPPNHNVGNGVRTHLHASKALGEETNVIFNNLSASSLLDIVTFNKLPFLDLHVHRQPVVLLERLVEKTRKTNSNVRLEANKQTTACSPEKKTAQLSSPQSKSRNSLMYLRSRSRVVKKQQLKQYIKKQYKRLNRPLRGTLDRKGEDSDDDDIPLNCFRNNGPSSVKNYKPPNQRSQTFTEKLPRLSQKRTRSSDPGCGVQGVVDKQLPSRSKKRNSGRKKRPLEMKAQPLENVAHHSRDPPGLKEEWNCFDTIARLAVNPNTPISGAVEEPSTSNLDDDEMVRLAVNPNMPITDAVEEPSTSYLDDYTIARLAVNPNMPITDAVQEPSTSYLDDDTIARLAVNPNMPITDAVEEPSTTYLDDDTIARLAVNPNMPITDAVEEPSTSYLDDYTSARLAVNPNMPITDAVQEPSTSYLDDYTIARLAVNPNTPPITDAMEDPNISDLDDDPFLPNDPYCLASSNIYITEIKSENRSVIKFHYNDTSMLEVNNDAILATDEIHLPNTSIKTEAEECDSINQAAPSTPICENNCAQGDETIKVDDNIMITDNNELVDTNSKAGPSRKKSVDDVVPLEAAIENPGRACTDAAQLDDDDVQLVSAPNHYYGRKGIRKWIDSGVEPNISSANCPMSKYVNLRDVLSAPARTRDDMCNACSSCRRFIKIDTLTKLMQIPQMPSNDVYEFDAEREATESAPSSYLKRGYNRATTTPATVQSGKYRYFDLYTPYLHCVQVRLIEVTDEHNKVTHKITGANLVPKSEDKQSEDIYLAANEGMVDDLIRFMSNALIKPISESTSQSRPGTSDQSICLLNKSKPKESLIGLCDKKKLASLNQKTKPKVSSIAKKKIGIPNLTRSKNKSNINKRNLAKNLVQLTKRHIDNTEATLPNKPTATPGEVVEAPTFHLTEKELKDPIAFFEKVMPLAAKFGICKVVAPKSFQPACVLSDETKFKVSNQYIGSLYSRWGPAAREMTAIKAYLATQNVQFTRAPLREGLEVNLPKLFHTVLRNGGLQQVIERKRWGRVVEEMKLTKGVNPEKALDQIYCKYLLAYDILSNQGRQQIMKAVEKCWNKKHQKLLEWAQNPLHRQKKLLGESESESSVEEDDDADDLPGVSAALYQAEDCVMQGRQMTLPSFRKVASKAMEVNFSEPAPPTPREVENEYWRLVLLGTEHVCVNSASIDTRDGGYGFTNNKADPFGKHPWNLKMLSQNPLNMLSSLGAVLGVTVPTFHLGMVFSTSCWHRDPHMLPWVEYMHTGPPKIWYGIPNDQSTNFRKAVETLCPASRQNKPVWLPSDITMIPPNLLREHHVSLARVEQKPGEYIIVLPKAYSCSISTGYTESESVYFATTSWLKSMQRVFQEVRDSCEPTTFSLEQLLISLACDTRVTLGVLQQVHADLSTIVDEELRNRNQLTNRGIPSRTGNRTKKRSGSWNVRELEECEICRTTLYLSKVVGIIGKKSSVCLQHAVRLLEMPRNKGIKSQELELVVLFTENRLSEIMTAVQRRLLR